MLVQLLFLAFVLAEHRVRSELPLLVHDPVASARLQRHLEAPLSLKLILDNWLVLSGS